MGNLFSKGKGKGKNKPIVIVNNENKKEIAAHVVLATVNSHGKTGNYTNAIKKVIKGKEKSANKSKDSTTVAAAVKDNSTEGGGKKIKIKKQPKNRIQKSKRNNQKINVY
jgi:hypothetical protein